MSAKKEIIPFEATHPGTLLKDELDVRQVKQKDFALELGVLPTFLNEIIKGKRPITADFAILLEKILEIPADYWLRFQAQFEIDKARIKEKNIKRLKLIEIWGIIKEYVPIKYLKKLRHITSDIEQNIERIKSIYGIKSIEELVDLVATQKNLSFYRKSDKLKISEVNMLGWSKLAELEASKIRLGNFKENQIPQILKDLKSIFYKNKNVKERTKNKLEEFGIKLIFLEKLEKTPIDGYAFWNIDNPAIALTLRHKRIDNFAFTIFHELGHITLHIIKDRNSKFMDIIGFEDKNICENEADKFAKDNLIPPILWKVLLKDLEPISDDNIISFSRHYKINPAIVLGRISWETDFYKFKSKIDKSLF